MTREDLLTCWISGAPLAALARLLGEEPEALEDGLRMELRRLAEAERPAQRSAPNRGGAATSSTARKRGGSMPSPAAADLSGYPKPLQDHRAIAQRSAWDALTDAPQTVRELAQRAGLDVAAADAALRALRRHGLATTDGSVPARWMRRQP
jgi:predicted transcriptional regulator